MNLSEPINKIDVYKTIAVLSLALLLSYFYWKEINLLYGLVCLQIVTLLYFPIAEWIHRAWMGLASLLAWINTRILLSAIFYLILSPLALLQRLFSASKINSSPDNKIDSYFEAPDTQDYSSDLFKRSW